MPQISSRRYQVPVVDDWRIVARDVAAALRSGDVLALEGPLGAGKTTFVQALAEAMGSLKTPKSPTFSLLRTYVVKQGVIRRLLHVDAYRIEDERDLRPLDLDDELADGDAVLVLEWPEQVPRWLKSRPGWRLLMTVRPDGCRSVVLSSLR